MKNVWVKITIGFLITIILLVVFVKLFYVKTTNQFQSTDEVFYNPLMGFAVSAENEDAVGENTLVYVDVTWAEWEPKEGVYAIDALWEENHLERWKAEGKQVVLRFVCDVPDTERHMDIPQWLYEQTGDGVFYDTPYGKGYSPEYTNELFIEKHRQAILALGEAFRDQDLIAYVELGSLGHWGEWHTNYKYGLTRIPSQEVREEYVSAYVDAFPYAKLMARRPFAETAELGFGVFNDMTGHEEDTKEWLEWISEGGIYNQPLETEELVAQPNIWETSPVGGEFTSSISFEEMLVEDLDETISLIEQSHMTFIGPKCPVLDELEVYEDGVEEVLKTIGYRYGVSEASIFRWKWAEGGTLTLTIENRGIAPIYYPWSMYLYICDEDGVQVERMEVPVSLMDISGGESETVKLKDVPVVEGYTYWIGIENPTSDEPEVYLDMDCESNQFKYNIITIE